jgi:hypothetical protein
MKSILYHIKGLCFARFYCSQLVKSFIVGTMLFAGIHSSLLAQDHLYRRSSWWFGPAGGVNYNLYHGSTQVVNSDLTISATFQNTKDLNYFAFPVLEFHRPDSKLGFTLNAGYDNRSGSFDSTFHTKLAYITLEPSIRLNLFNSPFYLFSGPRIAFNVDKRYTYQPDINSAETGGDFSDMKKQVISMQIGAGYDLSLTAENKKTQVIFAPFVSFHPYFGQNPRTIESWNLTTMRAGVALKFGSSHKKSMSEKVEIPLVIAPETEARLIVNDSKNDPISQTDDEIFPLKDYVYFNLKPVEISMPNVDKPIENQEAHFLHSSLGNLSDSSFRQMIVNENFLNILGERMTKNPLDKVTLIGTSKDGSKDGLEMAESIETYLTDIYGIESSRVGVKGRYRIKIKSEKHEGRREIALLRERDRQVLIKSNSKDLQMEFRGSSNVASKSLKKFTIDEASEYSYVTFKTEGADEALSSWILKITDELGNVQNFGPYNKDIVSISGKSILGNSVYGKFKVVMIGILNSGQTVAKDTVVYLSKWTPPASYDEAMRFKIIYEYNNSKSINIYKQYLTKVIIPNISHDATVVIHGHTENVRYTDYNLELMLARVNDAREILEKELEKANRTDVKFLVYGFGKDQIIAPFGNPNLVDKFSNRTVFIDIIPSK